MRLKNKRAIVTGGSNGIGYDIAKAFAKNGADVLLIARNEENLSKACKEIEQDCNVNAIPVSADISKISGVKAAVEEIFSIWDSIDILVNNAGTAAFIPFETSSPDDIDRLLDLNVKAPFFISQKLMPALKKKKGNIINISSYFSDRMIPGTPSSIYSLTKGAINSFTKALAFEMGPKGVRVNAIAPGTVNTPLVQHTLENMSPDNAKKFSDMIKTIYPLGRIGNPEDISGMAVTLASDDSQWITGAIINIDGGLTTN